MEIPQVQSRILETIGIGESHIDLVRRILDLENDKERVHSIEIHHGRSTRGENQLYFDIKVKQKFTSKAEFETYLKQHDLPDFDDSISYLPYQRYASSFCKLYTLLHKSHKNCIIGLEFH